ncbi:MAG: glycosyltransferase family 9 protein [Capnocytophaga sp.]|nr:glycosyltransferase family 9 protein [Capnocytophaga sp.]
MKIAVIQKKLMGDVLMSSVVFQPLKEKFPDAELHFLIDQKYFQVVKNHPLVDKFLFFDDFFTTLRQIRREKYDIVIDPYSKIETALLSFLSGANIRCGFYKKYTQFFYSHSLERRKAALSSVTTTAIEHRLQLLEPLDIPFGVYKPKIYISDEERNDALALLSKWNVADRPLLMISTFGSSGEKTYPLHFMKEVIQTIVETSHSYLLCNYLPSQKTMFQQLYDSLQETTKQRIVKDFDTANLREYISVLSLCKALIGNEGGSTNISKALGIPTFSIFSPTVDKHGWNWGEDGVRTISVELSDYLENEFRYELFEPIFFKEKLIDFITKNDL